MRQATFEFEDLILVLATSLFVLLFSAFGISFVITRKINKTVWTNFEYNLQVIEQFTFNQRDKLNLQKSNIEEFDRLNHILESLTDKLKLDYQSLKEFTENASHEIQTPLATVMLNLEEVLQQKLDTHTFKLVVAAINAVKKLSTLNQGLILLTKIENKQFAANKTLNITELIKIKLEEFAPLFETKKLNININAAAPFNLKINEQLADLLINNLLSNAIKHNHLEGHITIDVNEHTLKIYNSGEENNLTDHTIFERFTKGNSKSFGLGLSIVKKICDTHQLEIHYLKTDVHCFQINQKIAK